VPQTPLAQEGWCARFAECVRDYTGSERIGERASPREIGYDGWYAMEDETGKDVVDSLKEGKRFLESALAA
jgi:hypothetical protein